jgi:hypothetical protein
MLLLLQQLAVLKEDNKAGPEGIAQKKEITQKMKELARRKRQEP